MTNIVEEYQAWLVEQQELEESRFRDAAAGLATGAMVAGASTAGGMLAKHVVPDPMGTKTQQTQQIDHRPVSRVNYERLKTHALKFQYKNPDAGVDAMNKAIRSHPVSKGTHHLQTQMDGKPTRLRMQFEVHEKEHGTKKPVLYIRTHPDDQEK